MITFIYNLVYPFLESFWRRWFGGLFDNKKILSNRFLQHVVGFIMCAIALYLNDYSYIQIILASVVLQALYWARSHGCCFDFGHDVNPDLKRYDQLWYWKYVKKIIPESEWYTFTGDYILMAVRYTIPAIIMSLIMLHPPVAFMGLLLTTGYALMWKFYDWGMVKHPTEIAEYIGGFVTGLMIVFG